MTYTAVKADRMAVESRRSWGWTTTGRRDGGWPPCAIDFAKHLLELVESKASKLAVEKGVRVRNV